MRSRLYQPLRLPQQTAIIVATSALCGLSYLFAERGGFIVGQVSGLFAYCFGPLLCLYLFFRMFCDVCLRSSGKHPVSFFLGALFGFGTFFIWYCHHASARG